MSPITKETYIEYLPQEQGSDDPDVVLQGAEAELDIVTGWLERKIQNKLLEHFVTSNQTDLDGLVFVVDSELKVLLTESEEILKTLDEQIKEVRTITRPSEGGTDYTFRDVEKLENYREVLRIKSEALRELSDDKQKLQKYTQDLSRDREASTLIEINDIRRKRDEPELESDKFNREFRELIAQQAAAKAVVR